MPSPFVRRCHPRRLLALALAPAAVTAQPPAPSPAPLPGPPPRPTPARPTPGASPLLADGAGVDALVTVGSPVEERLRLAQLISGTSAAGYLLRSTSTLSTAAGDDTPDNRIRVAALLPEARVSRNSALPTPDNDGALWAGRGLSVLLRGGARVRAGRVTVVLAPELMTAQNLGFQSTPTGPTGQFPPTGPWQPAWFAGAYSADLPIRFGDQRYTLVTLGQSAAYVRAGAWDLGATTENEWWGPGSRNALLLSNAAEGVPRLFARTRRPLATPIGRVEARVILGSPTRSIFFDRRPAGPRGEEPRALSGAAATLRIPADTNLTVGVARLVLSPTGSSGLLGHALDVVTRNQSLGLGDTLPAVRRVDQLTSLFARWVLPAARSELYAEVARAELPRSLRDFAAAPQNTAAYTLGLASAWRPGPPAAGHVVRLEAEVTNLEQTRAFTDRPPVPDYYTGRAAPAGFTNRGQVLGAAIGPGSSAQWLAVDYFGPRARVGVFARRSRNQNDAGYRNFLFNLSRHDVTLATGVRAGWRLPGVDARAELGFNNRLNYLFQNGAAYTFQLGTVDVRNVSLAVDLAPRRPAR